MYKLSLAAGTCSTASRQLAIKKMLMKWFLFFLGVVSSSIANAQGLVKLMGKVEFGSSDSIEVSYNDNNLAYYPKKYSAKLDKTGKFSLSFPVPASYTIVQLSLIHI